MKQLTIIACGAVLLLGTAAPGTAQALRLGVGPAGTNWGGDMTPSALILGALELRPEAVLGIRVGGLVGAADYSYVGIRPDEDPQVAQPRRIDMGVEPLAAADISLVARVPRGVVRPYGLLGLGYNYFRAWESHQEPGDGTGWLWGLGITADVAGHEWFVEVTQRYYGLGDRFMNGEPSFGAGTLGLALPLR